MASRIYGYIRRHDWLITLAVVLLLAVGLTQIYGISLGRGGATSLFKRQIIFTVIGLIGYIALSLIDYRRWRGYIVYLYGLAVVLLTSVLVFGKVAKGTKGWFGIAGLGVQPVELIKLILILVLAGYFANQTVRINQLRTLITSGLLTLVLVILVLLQPDLGSALLLVAIWAILVLIMGFDYKYLLWLVTIAVFLAIVSWFFFFTNIQKNRIISFINPEHQTLGRTYNVNQAMIAVGSGRWLGRGVGFGSQTQLKFLPEAPTDFIFSVIAEERGFFGAGLVIILFAVIAYRGLGYLSRIKDDFGAFIIIAGVGLLIIESFVNIAMNIGLLPIVGIALPLVSYGGSSLVSSLLLLGVINSVIIRARH